MARVYSRKMTKRPTRRRSPMQKKQSKYRRSLRQRGLFSMFRKKSPQVRAAEAQRKQQKMALKDAKRYEKMVKAQDKIDRKQSQLAKKQAKIDRKYGSVRQGQMAQAPPQAPPQAYQQGPAAPARKRKGSSFLGDLGRLF